MDFETLIRTKGKCCATGKPLHDSKHINLIGLEFKAGWEFPVHGNFITGEKNLASAIVHDDAIDQRGHVIQPIQYAVEIKDQEIIYHNITTLEKHERRS